MLFLHKDCVAIQDRKSLESIATPHPFGRWLPIPHAELANAALDRAKANGLKVESEQWGVSLKDGNKLYGVLNFKRNSSIKLPKDIGLSMGIKSSIDKTVAIGICSGAKVMVCDNGVMIGDFAIRKLHTIGFRLHSELDNAFAIFKKQASGLSSMIKRLKSMELTDDAAKVLIFDSFVKHQIMPITYLIKVAHEYFEPGYEEFKPRTMWSLYNSVTEVLKTRNPNDQHKTFRRLDKVIEEFYQTQSRPLGRQYVLPNHTYRIQDNASSQFLVEN